jgi:hypothetical protein
MSTSLDPVCIVQRLRALSSAEEFFAELRVPYDPAVLAVARLHILKRMGEYLDSDEWEGLPDYIAAPRAQARLANAYADFAASSPLKERVFKVLRQRDPTRAAAFVGLDEIEPLESDDAMSRS